MGDRIPPEVWDRFLLGSLADGGDPASLFAFVVRPLFNPVLLLLSWLLPPLTWGGKLGCSPLLRLLDGTELPSLWLTGPEEAFRLLLLLWVGMLDMEFLPESESVPGWRKKDKRRKDLFLLHFFFWGGEWGGISFLFLKFSFMYQ